MVFSSSGLFVNLLVSLMDISFVRVVGIVEFVEISVILTGRVGDISVNDTVTVASAFIGADVVDGMIVDSGIGSVIITDSSVV